MENSRFLLGALLITLATPSQAALLLYEGFNGYTAGTSLENLAANANTTGIALTGGATYGNSAGSNPPDGLVITNSGLSLGSLTTSGGAITFDSGTNVASIGITSTTAGTTLWGSYLARLNTTSNTSAEGVDIRLNSTSNSSATSAYFRSDADSRGSSGTGPAVSYDNGVGTAAAGLTTATTYILISRFTGLGGTTGGTATVWALNSAQFANFVTAGRTEEFFDTPANFTATSTSSQSGNTARVWNGMFFEIVTGGTTGTLDEFRYGETLLDVTPIPEPASLSLLGAGSLLLLRRRRK